MIELTLADETPATEIPDIPWWTENFCFPAFDPVTNVGFWIHLGRWSKDPTIWREQILLFLPDGTFLIHRAYGTKGPRSDGAAGAGLEIGVPAPGQTLTLKYKGSARHTTADELAELPLREKALERVEFDFTFEGTGEIWEWGASLAPQTGSRFHIEQPGKVTGTLHYGDSSVTIDAYAHRDHSRGPRDVSPMVSSHWGQGHFPSGRSFAVCQSRSRDGDGDVVEPKLSEAVIWDNGRLIQAKASPLPYLVSPWDTPSTSFRLLIECDELAPMEVEATIVTHLLATTDKRFECYDGLNPRLGVRCLLEAPTLYTWNGEAGAGWAERGSSFTAPR